MIADPASPRPAPLLGLALLAAVALGAGPAGGEAPRPVDFGREILPILSDNCLHCHGPDPDTRKGGIRLDRKADALRAEDPVIVPGKADESELIYRIESHDPAEAMPPPGSNRALKPGQAELLRRWVAEGAAWGEHWAFEPPRRPELPAVGAEGWAKNPVDRFVLAGLDREGLEPAPAASKETLIRRATLDLTGLPPTLAEVDAFLADPAPDAYERVVDRLLASPRYGERMASDWLDLARYADTHGYQADRDRPMWPYRDWVVRALNANLPYDQFLTWQLAGDLMPGATRDQRLATAFNRLHMQNEEGGIVAEEFRVAYVADRVATFGTAMLGLTLECARCHDHKFDPISQRDYYKLFAFFQNIDESGQTAYYTGAMPVPTLLLSSPADDAALADLDRRVAAEEGRLRALADRPAEAFDAWLRARPSEPTIAGCVGIYDLGSLAGGAVANAADPAKPGRAADGIKPAEGPDGPAAELDGDGSLTFPGVGHFARADPFTLALRLRPPAAGMTAVVAHHTKAPIDAASRGYEILLEAGKVAFGLHHTWPADSAKIVAREPLKAGEWAHVAVSHDGSGRASGMAIYVDGVAAAVEVIRDGLVKDITYGGDEPDLAIGARFRDAGFKGGRVDDFRVFARRLAPIEVAHLAGRPDLRDALAAPVESLTADQKSGLLGWFLVNAPAAVERQDALRALRRERDRIVDATPEVMAMRELDRPKPAFVLKRGAYDAPGDPVAPDTPAALPPFPAGQPRDRLGLARWLTAPGNPLAARVAANRAWQLAFGRGLLESSDNFGRQGTPPTYPELLDWLADEFVATGWDSKRLIRLLVTSATYRQSSKADPALLARDPDNKLLARGPSRRLTAEMLRDQALAASGLLVESIGGPAVKPYQPDGVLEVAMLSKKYDRATGPGLYRRSLYTYWKRTTPHPAMLAFDAAERNVCVARRQATATPLQALALLNDTQIVEAARQLAGRMLREGGDDDRSRATWLFRAVVGRRPVDREVDVLAALLAEQRQIYAADRDSAAKLLAVGDSPNDPALDPVELAAGAVLAGAILNHDEAIMRR